MTTERALGEHSARLASLEAMVEKIDGNVEMLVAAENQRKGAIRGIYTVATLLGSLGGMLAGKYLK